MSDDSTTDSPSDPTDERPKGDHAPPEGAETTGRWSGPSGSLDYVAAAGWTVLRTKEKPTAEIFAASYVASADGDEVLSRPVTFVFNGGPGASSAYLHMGAIGPARVAFPPDGTLPRMPPRVVPNEESWLAFSDLVFVDPVGTGFSRVVEDASSTSKGSDVGASSSEPAREGEFFGYKRDLESLCEFMARWLSDHGRWGSPVFVAGESYGGYRVGRLVRLLQETTGIGLCGAVLISPALELEALDQTDYNALPWVDQIPTMALTAVHHGRSRAFAAGADRDDVIAEAVAFATGDYVSFLTRGAAMGADDRDRVLTRLADIIGLPIEFVVRAEGRVGLDVFARELLRDERRVLGLYDTTITTVDPFPDRPGFEGADPTLTGVEPAYTAAVNRQLRSEIGVTTDRQYVVVSMEVNRAWRNDAPEHFFLPPRSATDDFRYGMALNPHLRAFVCHGAYDLVCPFHTSDRLRDLMRLDPATGERVTVRRFGGGHMFYAWEESRREFTAAMTEFYAASLDQG